MFLLFLLFMHGLDPGTLLSLADMDDPDRTTGLLSSLD